MTNIVDQKRIEQELLLASEIIKNIGEGVYLVKASDGVIVYANPKFEKMFDYNPGEMLGKHVSIVNAPTDKKPEETAREIMGSIAKTGEWKGEVKNIKKDGTLFWSYANVSVFDHPEHGKVLVAVHSDITERKRTEEALRESEERLRDVMLSVADWVWEVDENGAYTFSSQKGYEYFGKNIIGKTPFDFMPADEVKRVTAIFSEVVARKAPIKDLENWNIRENGERICLLTNGLPILDKQGNLKGYRGVDKDITERKNLENLIFKERQEQQVILDSIPAWVFYKDSKNHFIRVNKAFADVMGVPKNELEGKSLLDIFPKEQAEAFLKDDMEVIKSGKPKVNIIESMKSPKGILWVQTDKIPYRDEKGNIIGIIGFTIDITERKKVEDSLRESETKYKTLINAAPLCIKLFDGEGRLISVNLHGKKEHFLEGKSDEEIKNWQYLECIEEKYRDLVKEKMKEALAGKDSEFDMEHVPGTSTGHWCHSNLAPARDASGQIKYVLFISRDITKEKEAEEIKDNNLAELRKFKELTVGRELKMVELKSKITELENKK